MKIGSIGFDSSNYTTSAAFIGNDGEIINSRKLLPVAAGEKGLRQSDAVFQHIKQYPEIVSALCDVKADCVGVSVSPRNEKGSYMPCFLVGKAMAAAAAIDIPLYEFSHQQGHIAAGILSCGNRELFGKPIYAFHISGGTTELLSVNGIEDITIVADTLDLTCGQLIDRIGVMLGLGFPCGKELEKLSETGVLHSVPRIAFKDGCCCLSGFENKIEKLFSDGMSSNDIALYTLETVYRAVSGMLEATIKKHGDRPCLFVGGVMSNKYIREKLSREFESYFATPELSSDNAVGVAYLAKLKNDGVTL